MSHFGGRLDDQSAISKANIEGWDHEISERTWTLLGIKLEATHISLWQRTLLHFACVMRV